MRLPGAQRVEASLAESREESLRLRGGAEGLALDWTVFPGVHGRRQIPQSERIPGQGATVGPEQ